MHIFSTKSINFLNLKPENEMKFKLKKLGFQDWSISALFVSQKHRQENRRLVGHFYDMKNRFWAVGCGLGWAVEKKVWAFFGKNVLFQKCYCETH